MSQNSNVKYLLAGVGACTLLASATPSFAATDPMDTLSSNVGKIQSIIDVVVPIGVGVTALTGAILLAKRLIWS